MVGGNYRCDSLLSLDWVGEAETVADDGAVFETAQIDVEFIFWVAGAANLEGADVPVGELLVDGNTP